MNFHNAVVKNPCTRTRQEFLLFCICVAGKKADVIVPKLRRFLEYSDLANRYVDPMLTSSLVCTAPFDLIKWMEIYDGLEIYLKSVKMGRYSILVQSMSACAHHIDVNDTSVQELMSIPGIGPKTARYFMVYAHDQRYAIVDTHVKRFLVMLDIDCRHYDLMERSYLYICNKIGYDPRKLDNIIWQYFARGEMIDEFKEVLDLVDGYVSKEELELL